METQQQPQTPAPAPEAPAPVEAPADGELFDLLVSTIVEHDPDAIPLLIATARKPLPKISPYAKVARERAQAPKPEHRPNLRLSVRGAQKSGR